MQVVGVSLATSRLPIAKKAAALARACGGKGSEGDDATVWVDGGKSSVTGAVFCNSTLADAMDWEDCSWTGHPSAGISPVALSVGEALHKSGKDVITAVVAGYEVYQRIAMAVQPPADWPNLKGWGLTSWQIYAALAPAAKLYGLNPKQVNQAFGSGATSCPTPGNLHHMTMSDGYHYEHGFRSMEGVMAVRAAMEGVENYCDCFDDPWAFENHLSTDPKPEWYTKDLGERWLTMETLLKHWPANIWVQGPVEAMHELYTKHPFDVDDVEKITLSPQMDIYSRVRPRPYQFMFAQYTASHCLAAYLNDPDASADWFSDENRAGGRVAEIESKIELLEPKMGAMDALLEFFDGTFPEFTVTVKLKNGEEYVEKLRYPKGHPRNQFSLDEERAFFKHITTPFLGEEKANAFVAAIDDLENVADIGELIPLLCID